MEDIDFDLGYQVTYKLDPSTSAAHLLDDTYFKIQFHTMQEIMPATDGKPFREGEEIKPVECKTNGEYFPYVD